MSINPTDPRPAYQQIAGHLRAAIAEGKYPAGQFLPSERQLARQYGVTPLTARQAVGVLTAEGLLDVRPGRGAFVRKARPVVAVSSAYVTEQPGRPLGTWRTELEAQGHSSDQRLAMVGRVQAPPDIAARLRLPDPGPDDEEEGPVVVVRRRLMLVEGEPYQLADSYYPVDIAGGSRLESPTKIAGGSVAALARLGYAPERHAEEVTARMPTPEERRSLNLGGGVPVIRLLRTTYAADDRPVEVTDMLLAADRHALMYDLPARAPAGASRPAE
jgi:GntR family transcriptional regulator